MVDFLSITSHYGSVSGSVAADQNSELYHKLTALQNGFLQIDILIVIVFPLVMIGFDSITSKKFVIVLSNRYIHWSRFITRNDIYV